MDLSELKRVLGDLIRGGRGLAGVEVLSAYPAGSHLALPSPAVLLSIEGVELSPGGLQGFARAGGQAEITLRFDFYARGDGGGLGTLYEALCGLLIERGGALGVCRIWCAPLAWDEVVGGYRLTARVRLRGRVVASASAEASACDEGGVRGFDLRAEVG